MENLKNLIPAGIILLCMALAHCMLDECLDTPLHSSCGSLLGEEVASYLGGIAENLPELLPRTDHTDSTIVLFEKFANAHLLTQTNPAQIEKVQSGKMEIGLSGMNMNNIPETIEPGLVFKELRISGARMDDYNPYIKEIVEKFLRALEHVWVERLRLLWFDIQTEVLTPTAQGISLVVTNELYLYSPSPPFLVWFCDTVDLSASEEGIRLILAWCDTTSIKCLDNLGIQNLFALCVDDLPLLRQIDCRFPNTSSTGCELSLLDLPNLLSVSKDVANSMAEKEWNHLSVDMPIWNSACCLAEKCIGVSESLSLVVTSLKDLDVNVCGRGWAQEGIRAERIVIYNNTKETFLTRAFINAAMDWLRTNASGVLYADIDSHNKENDPEVEAFIASAPIEACGLPNLQTLMISGIGIPFSVAADQE
ncbi:hypothetical protein NEDG_01778 [Nematocida displodere]|uniref:Uncharacterized protein n=1 Tax=Nematocida displodere TaxID=1805483 RepID=A0A177EIS0_9MICR|nr:hypothetical protein NEDG_01778 [Nematocida displodere]